MDLLQYYPLRPGSTHTYQLTFLGRPEGHLTLTILDAQERPSGIFARARRSLSGAGAEPDNYAIVLKDGELRVDGMPLLQAAAAVGERWERFGEGGMLEYELASLDRTVTVPAGTFGGCAEVRVRRDDAEVFTTVLAPGVGMVWHRAMIPGGYSELSLLKHDAGVRVN